jgi:Arc/MetJ-type ribon-helix-helix transcriptional regulator
MQQLVIRVPDSMAAGVDQMVAEGAFESRSEVVRAAIAAMLDRRRRDDIGRRINEGYERIPVTEAEMAAADAAALVMIKAEPW